LLRWQQHLAHLPQIASTQPPQRATKGSAIKGRQPDSRAMRLSSGSTYIYLISSREFIRPFKAKPFSENCFWVRFIFRRFSAPSSARVKQCFGFLLGAARGTPLTGLGLPGAWMPRKSGLAAAVAAHPSGASRRPPPLVLSREMEENDFSQFGAVVMAASKLALRYSWKFWF